MAAQERPALSEDTCFARVDGVFFALSEDGTSYGVDHRGRLVPLDATYAQEMSRLVAREHRISEEDFWRYLGEPGG